MSAPAEGSSRPASEIPLPGGNFRLFVTRLSIQGMLALGLLENPVTRAREKNLGQARMLVDDLEMLREKTAGNLSPEETEQLDKVIEDLSYALERDGE